MNGTGGQSRTKMGVIQKTLLGRSANPKRYSGTNDGPSWVSSRKLSSHRNQGKIERQSVAGACFFKEFSDINDENSVQNQNSEVANLAAQINVQSETLKVLQEIQTQLHNLTTEKENGKKPNKKGYIKKALTILHSPEKL